MQKFIKTGVRPMPSKAELQARRKQLLASGCDVTYAKLKDSAKADAGAEVWINDVYQVLMKDAHAADMALHDTAPPAWYLSIKRIDQEPICSWRDIQEIKNQLVGPDNDGFMLYPSEQRVVDTANQYHLFVMKDTGLVIPFGFNSGRWVTDTATLGAKQEPRGDGPSKARGVKGCRVIYTLGR